MSLNKFQPHVFVLPEDDANSQVANGFLLDQSLRPRSVQVLEVAGGWLEVLEVFKSDHVAGMDKYANRFMVLLIDFDGQQDRLRQAQTEVPARLTDRVFILGAKTEPEELRRKLGPYETIGLALAKDCREGSDATWGHDLLRHNAGEIERLRQRVRPVLF